MTARRPGPGRLDTALLVLTGVCVAALAVVAGAVSFAHMRELAAAHGQLGWKSYAFPISVDGLEIVASLYLVAQRRAGRPTGWVPWAALVIGTTASLAANVAVGGDDPVAQALAGWPALSMLVSVKLLFSMLDHTAAPSGGRGNGNAGRSGECRPEFEERSTQSGPPAARIVPDDRPPSVRNVPDASSTVPAVLSIVPDDAHGCPDRNATVPDEPGTTTIPPSLAARVRAAADTPKEGPSSPAPEPLAGARPPGTTTSRSFAVPGDRAAPVTSVQAVADLIPAARTARAALAKDGDSLSRDTLARALRRDGHALSNARASLLTRLLRAEAT